MRCLHCGGTRRQVTLWSQIIATDGGVVCCWTPIITPPAPKRGAAR